MFISLHKNMLHNYPQPNYLITIIANFGTIKKQNGKRFLHNYITAFYFYKP